MDTPIIDNNNLQYHLSSIDDLYEHFDADVHGLSTEGVRTRLEKYGANELRVKQDVPEILKFLKQFKNFFRLITYCGQWFGLVS